MSDKEKVSQAPFNMGIATLERIHKMMEYLNEYKTTSQNPYYISNALDGLYMELYPFLNDDEIEEGDKMQLEIAGCFEYEHGRSTCKMKVASMLHAFERFMRKEFKEKGLLMAQSDDPAVALGGR